MKSLLFLLLVYCWQPTTVTGCKSNPCDANPCGFRGRCTWNRQTCTASCACQDNFGGQYCQHVLRCSPNVCSVNEDCIVRNNQAICICKPGRLGNPINGCNVKVRQACIHGDPHYDTFDGFKASYHGTCPVILTQNRYKLANFPNFKVISTNRLCEPNAKISWLAEVEVTVYDQNLSFGSGQILYHNGVIVSMPFYWPNEHHVKIRVNYNGNNFIVETEHNFKATIFSTYACVMLPEIPSLRGPHAIMGLFGNIDGNSRNEMICKDGSNQQGSVESTHSLTIKYPQQFLKCQDSYITTAVKLQQQSECVSGLTLDKKHDSCNAKVFAGNCSLIKDAAIGKGPFAACKNLGETVIHDQHQDCIMAMCAGSSKCTSYNSFAARCQRSLKLGDSMGEWRASVGCPMQCYANSVYKSCSSACPRTCANLAYQETCNQNCVEKCECLPGYVVDNTVTSYVKCIRVEECGCKGPQGQWHTANQNFLNTQCNLYSGCYGGQYVSKSIQCSRDATCSAKNGIRQCVCNSGYVGDGYTCGVNTGGGAVVTPKPPQCNICASYPCQNGGTCVPDLRDQCHNYNCACRNPFSGKYCEVKLECTKGVCASMAECKIENSKVVCTCPRAYAGEPYKRGCFPYQRTCLNGNRLGPLNYFSTLFFGTCPVLMLRNKVKLEHNMDIEVIARQHGYTGAPALTAIKEIEVTLAGQAILIEDQRRVFLNGRQITLPYYYPTEKNYLFSIEVTYWTVLVKVPLSYIIDFGVRSGLCISVPIDSDFNNKTTFEGIGGNIGADPGVVCRDGSFAYPPMDADEELAVAKCIDTWIEPMKTKYKSEKCLTGETIFGNININKCNATRITTECSAIKQAFDGLGPFARCKVINPHKISDFLEDCALAVCLDRKHKCDSYAAFAAECANELKQSIGDWHSKLACPKIYCNQPNTEYKSCASQCQDTCAQRNRQTCDRVCREGCVCKSGFIIDNTVTDRLKCIRTSECGCADEDGKWYKAGSEWLSNRCRNTNKCENGALQVKRATCGDNAECSEKNGEQICACIYGYKGDGYTCTAIEIERITRRPLKVYTACSSEPCNNGGECVLVNDDPYISFRCKCQQKYTGAFCDDLAEDCNGAKCDQNANCNNENGVKKCVCKNGYEGDGKKCTVKEEELITRPPRVIHTACSAKPCHNGGECILVNDDPYISFRCKCLSKFTGVFCANEVEDCGEKGCDKNAVCTKRNEVQTCICKDGYMGDGVTCSVGNKTTTEGSCNGAKCHENAQCSKVEGLHTCQCNSGYTGNGITCTTVGEGSTTLTTIATTTIAEATTQPKHDICKTNPCKNDGVCIRDVENPGKKFACKCPSNFGGSLCDDLLECDATTCGGNASCTVMNNKVDCVCKKGYAGNPFKYCSKIRSACVAQDPHLKTFDGLEVDYHGTCPYLFTSSCGKSVDGHTPFQAVLKNHLSDGEGERYLSWVYEAEIELFNQTIHMDMYSEELTVNQVKQNPPFNWPDHGNPKITILFRARTYSIKTIDGLEFTFGNYKFCANLPETSGMKEPGALCGIAGNIDDKWDNDVFCRNNSVVKLSKQDYKFDFSHPELQKCQDTWITTMNTVKRDHTKCQTAETLGKLYMNSTCDVEVPTKLCHPIKQAKSKSGPFGICSVMGDHAIEGLYQDCIVEICPNTTHLCRELKVFASACRDTLPQDMDMGNWRKDTGCEMKCPDHSSYSTCKSACPETCAENGKPTCDKGCIEGCQCNPGYVLDNTVNNVIKCIKKEHCGCTDEMGNWHQASKPFLTNNCQFISQCENGSLVEKSHKCGKNAQCITANSRMQCYCKYGYAGDGYECNEVTVTEEKVGAPVTCYPGWKYFKITNKCYRNYDESLVTYEEGKRICKRNIAEPVSINIKEEFDFLIEKFAQETSTEKASAWVGLLLKSGNWQWLDGTNAEVNWNAQASKTKECVQWNLPSTARDYMDINCNTKATVICEAFPIVSSVCES